VTYILRTYSHCLEAEGRVPCINWILAGPWQGAKNPETLRRIDEWARKSCFASNRWRPLPDLEPFLLGRPKFEGAREEDVVLEMDVLME